MAEMNQTQVKYARQRAQEIFNDKKAALKGKFSSPGKTLTLTQKLNALEAGEFTIVEPASAQNTANLSSVYLEVYSAYPYRSNKSELEQRIRFNAETAPTYDTKAEDEAHKALKSTYLALTDELMLGDNQEALKLLKAFEAV